jgi:hypothetical protein
MSAALNITEASILKWKKFGTTKTLSRAGRPANENNWGRWALVREVIKNPMVTLTELQKDNHLCSTPPIRPLW